VFKIGIVRRLAVRAYIVRENARAAKRILKGESESTRACAKVDVPNHMRAVMLMLHILISISCRSATIYFRSVVRFHCIVRTD